MFYAMVTVTYDVMFMVTHDVMFIVTHDVMFIVTHDVMFIVNQWHNAKHYAHTEFTVNGRNKVIRFLRSA